MSAPARVNHPSFPYASHAVPAHGKHVSAVVTPNSPASILTQHPQHQHIYPTAASGHVPLGQRTGTDHKMGHVVVMHPHAAKPGLLAVHNYGVSAVSHHAVVPNSAIQVRFSQPNVVKR